MLWSTSEKNDLEKYGIDKVLSTSIYKRNHEGYVSVVLTGCNSITVLAVNFNLGGLKKSSGSNQHEIKTAVGALFSKMSGILFGSVK